MYESLVRTSPLFTAAIIVAVAALGMVSCGKPEPEAAPPAGSVGALRAVLDGSTQSVVLGGNGGPTVIVTPELSARVLGASIGGDADENLMWVDPTVLDGSYWTKEPRFWNAGGLRSWVAPEDLFFVNEAKDADSWFVPASLDPAPYTMVSGDGSSAVFEATIDLPANTGDIYSFTLRRAITLLSSPPAPVGTPSAGVEYMGIVQEHSLTSLMDAVIGEDVPSICLWSLLQVNPSGTTLVPLRDGADSATAYREYFNPLGDRLAVASNIISVKIDGRYRLKIGVRPEAAGRGIAFLRDDRDGSGVLFVKLFSVDPAGVYVDKPWGTDSDYGDAIELYNDDGAMGGFAEIECHGPAQRLAKGESQSHTVTLHIFRGPLDDLKAIGSALLDADLSQAVYF